MSFRSRLTKPSFLSLKLCNALGVALGVLALSACTQTAPSPDGGSPNAAQGEVVKAPEVETVAPLPTAMETFRQLAPAQGLKITPLFTGAVSNDEARFRRLEDAVQTLRNDLDTVMPSMVRMVNMEGDLRELIVQLRAINGENPDLESVDNPSDADVITSGDFASPPVAEGFLPDEEIETPAADDAAQEHAQEETAAEPGNASAKAPASAESSKKPAAEMQTQLLAARDGEGIASKPAAAEKTGAADASIKAIRLGDHGAVTRIVLDATAKPGYKAYLEEGGRRLIIELSATGWSAEQAAKLRNKKVTGYKFENGRAVFDLSAPMQIKSQQLLPPEGAAGYRIMINLADAAGQAKESPEEDNFLP